MLILLFFFPLLKCVIITSKQKHLERTNSQPKESNWNRKPKDEHPRQVVCLPLQCILRTDKGYSTE